MKTRMGAILAGAALAASGGAWGADEDGRAEALRKVESLKISVDLRDAGLSQAIDYLREVTGLNIVLSPKAVEKEAGAKVNLKVRDVSARTVLRLLLKPMDLGMAWRDGAFLVAPREELGAGLVLRMYDIRAYLVKIQDFAGPKVELSSPTASMPMGITVTLEDPKGPPVGEDLIEEFVKANTGRNSWSENPNSTVAVANGMLVVTQTPAVHREIAQLLEKLNQYR